MAPPTSMEVKLISCEDLKAFNFFQKHSIYTTVCIASQDPNNKNKTVEKYQQHKTPAVIEGDGGNLEWNHQFQFDLKEIYSLNLDLDNLFLRFHLLSQGTILGDKNVGRVRVPIKELIEESNGAVRFVSYQVMTSDGAHNGVLHFSYKVIEDRIGNALPTEAVMNGGIGNGSPVVSAAMIAQPIYPWPELGFAPVAVGPQVYYPAQEFYNAPEPLYPPVEVDYYYPPPLPLVYPPPPPPPLVYSQPPIPYGTNYDYGTCHHYNGDTW